MSHLELALKGLPMSVVPKNVSKGITLTVAVNHDKESVIQEYKLKFGTSEKDLRIIRFMVLFLPLLNDGILNYYDEGPKSYTENYVEFGLNQFYSKYPNEPAIAFDVVMTICDEFIRVDAKFEDYPVTIAGFKLSEVTEDLKELDVEFKFLRSNGVWNSLYCASPILGKEVDLEPYIRGDFDE